MEHMTDLMRTFIAVPLNAQIHRNLADFCRVTDLNSRERGFRPVRAENIHLTLKFLGEIDPSLVRDIGTALTQISTHIAPFNTSLRGIGAFPGWYKPRVIWVGMHPAESLRQLHQLIESALSAIGIPVDGKPFSPHLTMARLSFVDQRTTQVLTHLKGLSPEPEFGMLSIDRLNLYRSVLQPTGPVYSIMSSHVFSG